MIRMVRKCVRQRSRVKPKKQNVTLDSVSSLARLSTKLSVMGKEQTRRWNACCSHSYKAPAKNLAPPCFASRVAFVVNDYMHIFLYLQRMIIVRGQTCVVGSKSYLDSLALRWLLLLVCNSVSPKASCTFSCTYRYHSRLCTLRIKNSLRKVAFRRWKRGRASEKVLV